MRNVRLLPALLGALALAGCASRPEMLLVEFRSQNVDLTDHLLVVDSLGRTDYRANGLLRRPRCGK